MANPLENTQRIPVADFATLSFDNTNPKANEQFLRIWDHSFRNFGFIFLINHGLEPKYRQLHLAAEAFFDLPAEEKLKFRIADTYGQGGFAPAGQESVSRTYLDEATSRPPDAVESLVTANSQLDTLPCIANGYQTDAIREFAAELTAGLDRLTIDVMKIMAMCLELSEDRLLPFYQRGRANNNLRIANYLTVSGENTQGQIRYGEHTDYTGFTFLWRSADNGLQCLELPARLDPDSETAQISREDKWLDIRTLTDYPDALVVNAGDLIQRWTNDYWISNVHRVNHNSAHQADGDKNPISIVYFTGPHDDTRIRVLSQSKKVRGEGSIRAEYREDITAGEHLWSKINESN